MRTAKGRIVCLAVLVSSLLWSAGKTVAEPPAVQALSSEDEIRAALFGGVSMDRWKKGLLFEGILPDFPNS